MRAEAVTSHTSRHEDRVLGLEVKTAQYINRTAQTHDSVMHPFIEVPDTSGLMYFEIAFFTPDIFRVKYAGRETTLGALMDEPAFPPPEARMLVGKRQDVPVEIQNTDESIQLFSSAVELRVHRKPFQLLAYHRGGRVPFWRQRLADPFTADVIACSITQHQCRTATFEAFTIAPGEATV